MVVFPYTVNKAKCSCAGQEEIKAGNPGGPVSIPFEWRVGSAFKKKAIVTQQLGKL